MLKQLRQKYNMTQAELAGRVNIPQNVVSQIENGRIPAFPAWRKRICEVFKVEVGVIFDERGYVKNPR
jgi:transcriptional regulator with XRE-family HTH domain